MIDVTPLRSLKALSSPGEEDLLTAVIDAFLKDSPRIVESMREAASRRDIDKVRAYAHRLHGSACNLGAQGVVELCLELEQRDTPIEWHAILTAIERLEQRVAATVPALIPWRAQSSSSS